MKNIFLVTCTYDRPKRLDFIKNLSKFIHINNQEKRIFWIVVEDAEKIDDAVSEILPKFATYMSIGPTRDKGHVQRNLALEYIRDNKFNGIVYNFDDDNKYDSKIFKELKKVRKIAFFPVGNLGPNAIETPKLNRYGKFSHWDAGWMERKYPVDMAGFAFHTNLLSDLKSPIWQHEGVGGETEFIEKLNFLPNEIQFLCNRCKDVYVWHNGMV